jgi:hypothetical protein
MTLTDLITKIQEARAALNRFRLENEGTEISIHINALEIAINLCEVSIKTNPHRPISVDEEQWFNAGRYVELVLINSRWDSLINLYYAIVEEVRGRNFFR